MRRQRALDAVLIAALVVGCSLEVWAPHVFGSTHSTGPRAAVFAAYMAAAGALTIRRRFPLVAAAAVAGVLALEWLAFGAPEGFGVSAIPLVAAYSVAVHAAPRHALAGLTALLVAGGIWDLRDPTQTTLHRHAGALIWLAPTLIAWLVGRLHAGDQRERTRHLEHEREERALRAVAEERARIARELHDVVGHEVSVMTVQASAVRRLLRREQDREREALLAVERTGREALVEMRRFVGVLRRSAEVSPLAPQPGLASLGRLVEHTRDAGLPVELRIEGTPVKLPAGLDLTAFRIVQEALTNALKHARASAAEVVVRYETRSLELVVTDDGYGTAATNSASHGLVGMRERLDVCGGELTARPRHGGGFEIRARIPLAGG